METWKNILGFEGLYMISNLGRVKSISRKGLDGRIINGRILKIQKYSNNYCFVSLRKNGTTFQKMIHRLVVESFYGKSDLHVNHINFDKNDNKLSNLEYISFRDNVHHYFKTKKSSSDTIGVSWNKRNKKWEAHIGVLGKKYYLGKYKTEREASAAYSEKLALVKTINKDTSHEQLDKLFYKQPCYFTKINNELISEVKKMLSNNNSISSISRKLNVSRDVIYKAKALINKA